ncbi:MAG: fibronectin type III-like domain-contianing protein [Desulfobacteraceae bacterium]
MDSALFFLSPLPRQRPRTRNFHGQTLVLLQKAAAAGFHWTFAPMMELKDFKKIRLKQGEIQKVLFRLDTHELGFHNQEMRYVVEPGRFDVRVGGSSQASLMESFELVE